MKPFKRQQHSTMIQKIALYSLFALSLIACDSAKNTENKPEPADNRVQLDSKSDFEQRMLEIDGLLTEMKVAHSLNYLGQDGSTESVTAYFNEQEDIVKVTDYYYDAANQDNGKKEFYLVNGKRFATKHTFSKADQGGGEYIERISFYNEAEQVVQTKERRAQYEEYLEMESFEEIDGINCSMERTKEVLNQKGPFATCFKGFLSEGGLEYLIVGGPGKDSYTSALAIQYRDSQLQLLKDDPEVYLDDPLLIEFEKMIDERSFEFQILLRLNIL